VGFLGIVWFRGGFKKFCHYFRYPRPSDAFDNTFSPFFKSQIIEKAKKFLVPVVSLQNFSTPFYSFLDSFTIIRGFSFFECRWHYQKPTDVGKNN